MKVKDLKILLQGVDENMDVLIPSGPEFNGMFRRPCKKDSGVGELGIDENSNETKESFILVPCGFFTEHKGPDPELN